MERLRFTTPTLTFTVTRVARDRWHVWTTNASRKTVDHEASRLDDVVAYLAGAIAAAVPGSGTLEAGVCDYPADYRSSHGPPGDQEILSLSGPHGLLVLLVERCRRRWPRDPVRDPG